MGMFFRARVNFGLVALGLDPAKIDTTFRQTMQIAGQNAGNSPQEVALWIASQLPLSNRASVNPAPIKTWIRNRNINCADPEVQTALRRLGLEALIGFQI